MSRRNAALYLVLILALTLLVGGWYALAFWGESRGEQNFDGERAYRDVLAQTGFGSRAPGTAGHAATVEYIRTELGAAGWQAEIQESRRMGHRIQNILAQRDETSPQILLGAHYDTRMNADQDSDEGKRGQPVPGANDGASGVAVLLELARTLPADSTPVWLVFFDAEDNGRIADWDWILGSRAFAEEMNVSPRAVVIVDMVGAADLNLYYEKNSDRALRAEIWDTAAKLGYGQFIPQEKYSMLDDHTPFLEKGIAAVDIIDFDYPYWHTSADTADKVSPQSLEAVGRTLLHWMVSP